MNLPSFTGSLVTGLNISFNVYMYRSSSTIRQVKMSSILVDSAGQERLAQQILRDCGSPEQHTG